MDLLERDDEPDLGDERVRVVPEGLLTGSGLRQIGQFSMKRLWRQKLGGTIPESRPQRVKLGPVEVWAPARRPGISVPT
jgi:hypothetical protein